MNISPELSMSPREPELLATFFEEGLLEKSLFRLYRTTTPHEEARVAKVKENATYAYDRILSETKRFRRSDYDSRPLRTAIKAAHRTGDSVGGFVQAVRDNMYVELGVLALLDLDLIDPGYYFTKRDILQRLRVTNQPNGEKIAISGGGFLLGDDYRRVLVPSVVSVNPGSFNQIVCYDLVLAPSVFSASWADRVAEYDRSRHDRSARGILKNILIREACARDKAHMLDPIKSFGPGTPSRLLVVTDPVPAQVPGYDRTIQAGYRNFDATFMVALGLLGGRLENPKNWMEYLAGINNLAHL